MTNNSKYICLIFLIFFCQYNHKKNWETLQYDCNRNGYVNCIGPQNPCLDTLYQFHENVEIFSSPVSDNDKHLFISDNKNRLYHVNSEGEFINAFKVDSSEINLVLQIASPLIFNDEIIYSTSLGNIYSLNKELVANWVINTDIPIIAHPVAYKDSLLFVGNVEGDLYSISPNGKTLWQVNLGFPIVTSSPSISMQYLRIYIGAGEHIFALDFNGDMIWEYDAGSQINTPALIDKYENIYFGTGSIIHYQALDLKAINTNFIRSGLIKTESAVYSINAHGQFRWKVKKESPIRYPGAYDPNNDIVYFSSDELLAIDCHSGVLLWGKNIKDSSPLTPIIDANSNIYIGFSDGSIFSITKNGKVNWRVNGDGYPNYLIISNNKIITTGKNKLLCINSQIQK